MEAGASRFEHLREHSIGLPQVLFQSITHMAPAAAVAYSIFISVPQARQALPLSVALALIACVFAVYVYMLVSVGSIYWYWTKARSEFNWLLHFVLPIGGIVLFFFPLYYQFVKYPPAYPEKYGNWVDIAWVILGIALTAFVVLLRPDKLKDIDRVYVEDETVAPQSGAAASPAS